MSHDLRTTNYDSKNPASRLQTLPVGEPERTVGYEVAAWVEDNFIQPNGPTAGQPFRLTFDQFRFLLWWYAVDDEGRFLFHHAARRLAKGSGKSPMAAVIALAEFCGPVRLDTWDDRLPGGCKGKPVDLPLVQLAATAESQTYNTMRMVRAFAPKGSKLVDKHSIDVGKLKFYKLPEGTLEVITSSSTAAEGAEASFIVGDETENWKPSNGGSDLAETLQDNLAKSGSRMLETSNAWIPEAGTVAEATYKAWLAQEEGQLKDEAGLILYDARLAPPDTDMSDYASLRNALELVYGDCDWKRKLDGELDVDSIIARIWSPKSRPSESKRKYLNWPTAHEESWTLPSSWAALAGRREISSDEPIALFFDGSKSRDTTAFVACAITDGHVFVPEVFGRSTVWEPKSSHDTDDVVPVEEIDNAATQIFERYNPVAFFADVQEWESFTKVEWPRRFGDKLKMWAQPQGKDRQLIAWDMRSHLMDFTREAELVEAEIQDKQFTHDDNPILSRHVANMRRRPNRYGIGVGKESKDSPLKIDAGVCMIGARMVRRLYVAANAAKKTRTGGIW